MNMNNNEDKLKALSAASTALKKLLTAHVDVLKEMSDEAGIESEKIQQMSEEEYLKYYDEQSADMQRHLSFFSGASFVLGNIDDTIRATDERIDSLVNGAADEEEVHNEQR